MRPLTHALLAPCLLALCACSAGIGPAGSYLIHGNSGIMSGGVRASGLSDLSMAGGPAIAMGMEAQVEGRVDGHNDAFGQFHMLTLAGLIRQPRPEQFPIGYEALLTPGIARTYVHGRAELRPAIGLELGAPIRLAAPRPVWRSDDLIGAGLYLVPSVSGLYFFGDTVAVSASLSLRFTFWSALTP